MIHGGRPQSFHLFFKQVEHCGTSRRSDLQSLLEEFHATFLSIRKLVRKTPITNQKNHGLGKKKHHHLTFHRGCYIYLLTFKFILELINCTY